MSTMPTSPPMTPAVTDAQYAWQTCLRVESAPATPYQQHFNPKLLDVLTHAPRVFLDVGCSSGNLGAHVKKLHPSCRTIGIEPNRATADIAAHNLDQVLCGKFEDLNLDNEGITHGCIDTVILADVLEHMYDPWAAMVKLKPYLSTDAQIILSIPNTRHLWLMQNLLDKGMWTYAEKGLLDITHIRFFTFREIVDFLMQTGYRMEFVNRFLDEGLVAFHEQNKSNAETNIRFGRMVLEKVPPQELAELCTWQFFIRARVA